MGKYLVTLDYEIEADNFALALEFAKKALPGGPADIVNLEVSQLELPDDD